MLESNHCTDENHSKNDTCSVFISYSHDSTDHSEEVLKLADSLVKDGVYCILDQYEVAPKEGWVKWMNNHIDKSDYILVVCTEKYNESSKGNMTRQGGNGVKFETLLSFQDLYDNGSINDNLIPIIFEACDQEYIPKPLKPFQFYCVKNKEGYEALYRRLTNQPKISMPKLGQKITMETDLNHKRQTTAYTEQMESQSLSINNIESAVKRKTIEIAIDTDFDSFSAQDQKQLLNAIGELLKVEGSDLHIKGLRRGSVILSLELPDYLVKRLIECFKKGELEHLRIVGVKDHNEFEDTDSLKQLVLEKSRSSQVVDNYVLVGNELMIEKETSASEEITPTIEDKKPTIGTVTGTVKWFNEAKGFGFIKQESGPDVFAHFSSISGGNFKTLAEGQTVNFTVTRDKSGLHASDIKLADANTKH